MTRLLDAAKSSSARSCCYEVAAATSWTTRREPPDRWAAHNRVYGPDTGYPGRRDTALTPYVIPFQRAIAEAAGKRIVLVTAAQSGKTDAFLDIVGERLDNRPAPILYVGPSKEFVTDQFEPRLTELFRQSASLQPKVLGGIDSKRQCFHTARVMAVMR